MNFADESYLGRKRLMAPRIIGHMPRHRKYIELFLGTGEVLKQKPRAEITIGVEINEAVLAAAAGEITCASAQLLHMCAFDYLKGLAQFGDLLSETLLYIDPPYYPDTRTSTHRYDYDLSHEDHILLLRLLKCLSDKGVMIILSGYNCSLYEQELSSWRRVDYDVMTRGGHRVECLWMNFDQPEPYWPSQIGNNRQQRQDFKRRVASMQGKYRTMNKAQRLAIWAALCEIDAENML